MGERRGVAGAGIQRGRRSAGDWARRNADAERAMAALFSLSGSVLLWTGLATASASARVPLLLSAGVCLLSGLIYWAGSPHARLAGTAAKGRPGHRRESG